MSIKQSTSTTVMVGPLINTDGDPVTTFVLGQSHIKLSKNGSAFANKNSAATFTHNASGWYSGLLNTTDTNTCGELTVIVNKSGSLPYWTTYNVLPANIYDSWTGTDYQQVDVIQSSGLNLSLYTMNRTVNNISGNLGIVVEGVPTAYTGTSGTIVTGISISGTYANTILVNNNYWTIGPAAATVSGYGLNVRMIFNVGTAARVSQLTVIGRFTAATARSVDVWAYSYVGNAWESISSSTTRLNHSTTDQVYTYTFLSQHQDTNGNVKIRFTSSSTTANDRLRLDQVLVRAVTAGATTNEIAQAVYDQMSYTVYEGGVWIDTINGASGVDIGVNGLPTNPVNNYANALTIASGLGVKRFYFRPDSVITLTQSHQYWRFVNKGGINLNGQSIEDTWFDNCEYVSGISTGTDAELDSCGIKDITINSCGIHNSELEGTFTTVASGVYCFKRCIDSNPAALNAPTFVLKTGATIGFRDWRGGMQLNTMTASNSVKLDGVGRVIIDSSCTGGDLTIRGNFTITDNSAGAVTVTKDACFNVNQPLNMSGIQRKALSSIVASGNAANWSGLTPSTDLTTVNQTLNTISGFTDNLETLVTARPTITTIVNSGNIAGWDNDTTSVTVTGISPTVLSSVVASGNAAGWNSVASSDISGIVNGVWNHTIDVIDAETALKYMLAYTSGSVTRTGSVYAYSSYNSGSGILSISANASGRVVTKL